MEVIPTYSFNLTLGPRMVKLLEIGRDPDKPVGVFKSHQVTNEILSVSKEKDNDGEFLRGTAAGSAIQAVGGKSSNKTKEQIVDIDGVNAGLLAAVEYIEDIYKFYTMTENCPHQESYLDW